MCLHGTAAIRSGLPLHALVRCPQSPPVHTYFPQTRQTHTHRHACTHIHTHTHTPSSRDSGKAKLTPMNKHVLTGIPICLLPLQQLGSCKPLLLFLYCFFYVSITWDVFNISSVCFRLETKQNFFWGVGVLGGLWVSF